MIQESQSQQEGGTTTIQKFKIKKYKVIMYNDDKTPFDFVQMLLMQVFSKSSQEAYDISKEIHEKEQAIVGIYAKEIAVTKAEIVVNAARAYKFPLRCEAKPE